MPLSRAGLSWGYQEMKNTLVRLLGRAAPKLPTLDIGYLPTLDAAVLLSAQARGYFKAEGLDVNLRRQTSWQRSRELLASGELHAAHTPGTVPLCATLGIGSDPLPLRTAFVLSLGGSAFGLHTRCVEQLHAAGLPRKGKVKPAQSLAALASLIQQQRDRGAPRLRLAVTDRYSNGSYDLRYCLASVGIDPETDVELVPITPSRVLKSLRAGNYDGAWLDEPWGSLAASEGLVELMFSKHAYWQHSLSKVLTVHERFIRRQPRAHRALLRALSKAAHWLENHRAEGAEILAGKEYLNQPVAELGACVKGIPSLAGAHPHDVVFYQGAANFPWYSQAVWYLGQMIRWGDFSQVLDFKQAAQDVYLPKIYREMARELELPYPSVGYKNEGEHDAEWELDEVSHESHHQLRLGSDQFFDGRIYKPRQTMKYLNGLDISHISAPLDAMWAIR